MLICIRWFEGDCRGLSRNFTDLSLMFSTILGRCG